ncbi:type II toxin-antitoxin system RelE/ParE family toxin [Coraliomargarita sp. SDUM461003]|uniref:Type II toxin-antitoxin system RelE/ParE family toxin n=1 Tax=Thalassobacterium maritimum TaxID=3041265 RepID=A0ABU1AZN9_9BACT|nr:type II toxin-antitoxin system RelE/ParE family toxin [Coraliomargarita sp. SDUM461003]MDQ8209625.1 type II toxin-antitoxin system RelE/ParE family toxin [Coraliomargarita sp. SDUM461003]
MIQSFRCKETAKIFGGCYSKKLPADIQQRALNKLRLIATVTQLETLLVPPSNHLEALTGDRKGQHSIRINKHVARQARRWSALRAGSEGLPEAGALWAMKEQWRICFRWKDGNAHDAEIVDYH